MQHTRQDTCKRFEHQAPQYKSQLTCHHHSFSAFGWVNVFEYPLNLVFTSESVIWLGKGL